MNLIIPQGYQSALDIRETEVAIKKVKDFFEKALAANLNLTRVSAPLFVDPDSGLNDNLNGVERPVSFDILEQNGRVAEIVHSLAKWKRHALGRYGFAHGEGLYTDMNAIRRDEETDNVHSLFVDQWDWERIIDKEERNVDTLKAIVNNVYQALMETEDYKKAQAKLEAEEAEGKKHKVGFIPMVKGYWKTLLLGCGTRWVDGTFYNIFIVWILSYCINWLGMPLIQTYIITIIACIFKIPFTLFGGWCAQKLGNTRTFVIGALASAVLSIPTLKVIELSKGNLAITIIGIVLGWSIAYNLIWAVISSLWSSYFETEVRYSGISFVYHVPSFLVAGMVPTICTLLINYGKGDTIYVGIYSTVVALISAACALALKARHDRGEK